MKKKKLPAILIVIVIAVGCVGPGSDPAPTPESMPVPSPETIESPVQEDNQITDQQNISIDYNDYGIDYEATDINFQEFPLNKLVAYFLGLDGEYSYGASYELHSRFVADPDEVLKYIALVGDNIVRYRPAKRWLCDDIVCRYYFDESYSVAAFLWLLDQLEETYTPESPEIVELILIMRNKIDEINEGTSHWTS